MKDKTPKSEVHHSESAEPIHQHEAMPAEKHTAGSKKSMIWMIVAIVLALLLVGLAIFSYTKIKSLDKKISDQQAQINDLNNQKQKLNDAAAAAATAATNAAASAAKSAVASLTQSDANQIKASSDSYCTGAGKSTECNPVIKKQLTMYADVQIQDASHLLAAKNSNGSWTILLGAPDLCTVGVDGPAVAGINAVCGR